MRPRFLPWAMAFVITRAGDLWSTSLFMLQPGGEAGEMNPLTSALGLGFWPVLSVNIALSAVLLYGHWHYCSHFMEHALPMRPKNMAEYVSLLYFGRTGHAMKALFTAERNESVHYGQVAHVFVKSIACVSVLVVLHNSGQFHSWSLNDHLRTWLGRPTLVYYGMAILLAFHFAFRMLALEYRYWSSVHMDR